MVLFGQRRSGLLVLAVLAVALIVLLCVSFSLLLLLLLLPFRYRLLHRRRQHGDHVLLLVRLEAPFGELPLEVDREHRHAQQRPVDRDEPRLDPRRSSSGSVSIRIRRRASPASIFFLLDQDAPGDREVPVEPRRPKAPTIRLHVDHRVP